MARVLVPIDESEQSSHALEHAFEELEEDEIVVLHVLDPAEAYIISDGVGDKDEWRERAQARAEEFFDEARETAEEYGRTIDTATTVGKPARAIVEYAEENDIAHIVLGSHGRSGLTRVLLGSVAESVVRRSPVPVTIVH